MYFTCKLVLGVDPACTKELTQVDLFQDEGQAPNKVTRLDLEPPQILSTKLQKKKNIYIYINLCMSNFLNKWKNDSHNLKYNIVISKNQ